MHFHVVFRAEHESDISFWLKSNGAEGIAQVDFRLQKNIGVTPDMSLKQLRFKICQSCIWNTIYLQDFMTKITIRVRNRIFSFPRYT